MRIAVCEDEKSEQQLLCLYLSEWGELRKEAVQAACFDSGESFAFSWEDDRDFDLLMLDIEMKGMSGLELAERIRGQDEQLPIVFVTGYDEYISFGYEVAALQYLVKPVQKEKLFAVLDRVLKEREPKKKLLFATEEGPLCLSADSIWYAEATGHRCRLCTKEKEYLLKTSFGEAWKCLEKEGGFVKCHRSYLVNLRHVACVHKNDLLLDNDQSIPMSRYVSRTVNEAFVRFYQRGGR